MAEGLLTPFLAASLLTLFGATGAWLDIVSRKIPNWLCVATAVAGLWVGLASGSVGAIWSPIAHALVALLVGMLLFRFGVIGGGDAKFYAALALWFPLASAPLLAALIGAAGLVLLVVWFAVGRLARSHRGTSARGSAFGKLPYGVAIASGAISLVLLQVAG